MSSRECDKEKIEDRILEFARSAGAQIPVGERRGKPPAPDFWFDDSGVAIELTELLCPAGTDLSTRTSTPLPVEREKFHEEVVRLAQQFYYEGSGVATARAHVVFTNVRRKRQDKNALARLLCDYVKTYGNWIGSGRILDRPKYPEGFTSISVWHDVGDWWSDECVSFAINDIPMQLADRIGEKNKNLPTYKQHLPLGAQVWLLIYTNVGVTRHVPVPYGIEQWRVAFDFDKVLWLSIGENRVIEIRRIVS
jgi:hypothetical protein